MGILWDNMRSLKPAKTICKRKGGLQVHRIINGCLPFFGDSLRRGCLKPENAVGLTRIFLPVGVPCHVYYLVYML